MLKRVVPDMVRLGCLRCFMGARQLRVIWIDKQSGTWIDPGSIELLYCTGILKTLAFKLAR